MNAAILAISMAIGAHADLQLNSMTTTERDAIGSPMAGQLLYDSTGKVLAYYDGTEWIGISPFQNKSYTYQSRPGASGAVYLAGFLDCPAADGDWTQASTTINYGSANHPYAAHAIVVASGAGSTDGSDLVLTVSGTSITDGGTRTGGDSEVLIGAGAYYTACQVNATAVSEDQMCETTKKWLGQITYTLSSSGGSTFSFTGNYGFAKYDDFSNYDFQIHSLECTGLANASDTGFDIELLKFTASGWDYDATAFVPGVTLYQMTTIHGAESDIIAGEQIAFKRTNLSDEFNGSNSEGFIWRITTGTNNAVSYLNCHIGAHL